jgi:probable HAF family extracellular repeat protein
MRSGTARVPHAIMVAATPLPRIAPRWVPLALAALLAVAAGPGAAPPVATAHADCYTFTLLKQPEDAGGSMAVSINNRGQIVGGVLTKQGGSRAVLWDGDEVRELGTLDVRSSFATAINDAGDVVGSLELSGPDPNARSPQQTFLYRDGQMRGLGPLGGPYSSSARDINASGQILGSVDIPRTASYPFVWRGGAMRELGVVGGGRAINRAGQVVGYDNSQGPTSAFVWQDGALRRLGPPPGMHDSVAEDINDAGQVVVSALDTRGTWRERAFVWQNGVWVREFDPNGQWQLHPLAINNAGQVVGLGGPGSSLDRSLLWDADGDWQELDTLACGASAEWRLDGRALNDAGQIVGWALQGQTMRAFLLTPPR